VGYLQAETGRIPGGVEEEEMTWQLALWIGYFVGIFIGVLMGAALWKANRKEIRR